MPSTLDPFEFQPQLASRVIGLGGAETSPDPAYVFHTSYVALAAGRYRATLAFAALIAEAGTLVVRVNAFGDEPGARAAVVATDQVRLREAAQSDGRIYIAFDAVEGLRYAILGHSYGGETAAATALTITLDPVAPLAPIVLDVPRDMAPTTARRERQHDVGLLVDAARPSLRAPRSQHATGSQIAEAAGASVEGGSSIERWLIAYVERLRAVYGLVDERFVVALSGDLPASATAHFERRDGGHDPDVDAQPPADMMLIALDPAERDATRAARAAMSRVRPGGIAVLLCPLAVPGSAVAAADAFDVERLQRLAVELLSWGYDVTQLAYDWDDVACIDAAGAVTWFAMIVSRDDQPAGATT